MSEIVKDTSIEVGISENSKVALLFNGLREDPVLLKFEEADALGLAASIINAVLTLKKTDNEISSSNPTIDGSDGHPTS